MTAHEALWLIKVQLQKTEQNIQAVKVLEDIVKSIHRVHIDDELDTIYGTEAEHIKNHMKKLGKQDLKLYKGKNNE
jgi:hypothetical protein